MVLFALRAVRNSGNAIIDQGTDAVHAKCPFLNVRMDVLLAGRPFREDGISSTVPWKGCHGRGI